MLMPYSIFVMLPVVFRQPASGPLFSAEIIKKVQGSGTRLLSVKKRKRKVKNTFA